MAINNTLFEFVTLSEVYPLFKYNYKIITGHNEWIIKEYGVGYEVISNSSIHIFFEDLNQFNVWLNQFSESYLEYESKL